MHGRNRNSFAIRMLRIASLGNHETRTLGFGDRIPDLATSEERFTRVRLIRAKHIAYAPRHRRPLVDGPNRGWTADPFFDTNERA